MLFVSNAGTELGFLLVGLSSSLSMPGVTVDACFGDLCSICFHRWAVFGPVRWTVADASILPKSVVWSSDSTIQRLYHRTNCIYRISPRLAAAFIPGSAVELSFTITDALVGATDISILIGTQGRAGEHTILQH
jgi:hypothetical protein